MLDPLADGFKYKEGTVTFLLPKENPKGDDYEIILSGDSGNVSPVFSM